MAIERERERTLVREPDPDIDQTYEKLIGEFRAKHMHSLEGEVVIRGDEERWVQNRNANVQYLLHPYKPEAAYRHMQVFINQIHTHNGVHTHQGGLVLYVLEGHGRTVYDGEWATWEEGDLILLPIKPGGVEHQHFNDDPERPAKWLAFITDSFRDFLASELVQVKNSPDWKGDSPEDQGPSISQQRAANHSHIEPSGPVGDGTLLDRLLELRDEDRRRSREGEHHISGRSLSWEVNRQGKMKWYMHPSKDDTSLRTLVVFRQEIPAGSRSGRQIHPGGIVHYILKGSGHTVLDGERYDWKAGDLVALPIRAHGIDYQHFNDDPNRPVEFVVAMPNLFDVLGMDLGGRFEQVESAPEYEAQHPTTDRQA